MTIEVAIQSQKNLARALVWILVAGLVLVALGVVLGIATSVLPPGGTGAVIGAGAVCISAGWRGRAKVLARIRRLELGEGR